MYEDQGSPLSFDTTDKDERTAHTLRHLIGKHFQHTGNRKVYVVTDVVWSGEHDEWALIHRQVGATGCASIVRRCSNLMGTRSNGERRIMWIDNPPAPLDQFSEK